MGDSTDRHQPLHHRLSSVKGVTVVHQFQGEDTVGRHASLCCSVHQRRHCHGDLYAYLIHVHPRIVFYAGNYSANMHHQLLNIRLIMALNAHRRMQMQNRSSQNKDSMTFVLVIIVVVLTVCHVPRLVNVVTWMVKTSRFACDNWFYLRSITTCSSCLTLLLTSSFTPSSTKPFETC